MTPTIAGFILVGMIAFWGWTLAVRWFFAYRDLVRAVAHAIDAAETLFDEAERVFEQHKATQSQAAITKARDALWMVVDPTPKKPN